VLQWLLKNSKPAPEKETRWRGGAPPPDIESEGEQEEPLTYQEAAQEAKPRLCAEERRSAYNDPRITLT